MATSGSADFSVTEANIIDDALLEHGVIASGATANTNQVTEGRRRLNMIVKQWQGKSDFAPGLKVWTRKRATLFLEEGKASYVIGPSGDRVIPSALITRTYLTAAVAASQGSITLATVTGMSAPDVVGIALDDGSIHWTSIISGPAGNVIDIASGPASAASIGRDVWVYPDTSVMTRPLELIYVNRRNSDEEDTPLFPMTLEEYEGIGDKDAAGTPSLHYYEQGRLTGELFFDYAATIEEETIELTYLRPIEDFDAATDEPDYPQEWFRPLVYQLAMDWAGALGFALTVDLKLKRDEALSLAQNVNPENSDTSFEPDNPDNWQ